MYRMEDQWPKYLDDIGGQLIKTQTTAGQNKGAWTDGHIGPVYTTAINATILQLGKGYLPIYQR
jgi:hypothetical protein